MVQMLRLAAAGATVFVWAALTLVGLPLIEGGGDSPILQLAFAAAFFLWLAWAAVALAYDRVTRPVGSGPA